MTVYTVLCMIFFLVIYDSCFIELSRYYLGPTFKKEEKKKRELFFLRLYFCLIFLNWNIPLYGEKASDFLVNKQLNGKRYSNIWFQLQVATFRSLP